MSTNKILLPTNIDRWRKPVVTKLREISVRLKDFDFYSLSSPQNKEDIIKGNKYWDENNIHKIKIFDVVYNKYDITHLTSSTSKIKIATNAQKFRNRNNKILFTIPIEIKPGDRYYHSLKYFIEKSDANVAISKAVADSVVKHLGVNVDYTIGNGVDFEYFDYKRNELYKTQKNEVGTPYVLYVGYITDRKRPDIFIELAKKMRDVNFVMIGGFHDEHDKSKYYSSIKSQKNIKYLGFRERDDVRRYMAGASVLVFSSEYEGMPSTVLEASAMGLPTIARPVSSLPEIIEEGVNGWLYELKDLEIWEKKINEILIWSREEREMFREACREHLKKDFSWQSVAQKYAEVYESL